MDKAELRKQKKEGRDNISEEERLHKSKIIMGKLLDSEEYKQANCISFYVSFSSEVHTHEMIKSALADGKKICVPMIAGGKLLLSYIRDFSELDNRDEFGIPEPTVIKKCELEDVDLVIVPCVAFDKENNRIGYGGGYYDKLLTGYDGKKVALAFNMQEVDSVPIDDRDVRMDKVIVD